MNEEKIKILVIDDEKMNIMALAHFLQPQYDVIVAIDGASGLEAAEKHLPNIILLDILMPDMNGFDVLLKLKNIEVTMNIPVIFITGLTNAVDEEKGLSLGAVDYITKPFNKSVVRARIMTHIKMAEYVHTIEKLCMLDALTGLPNRRGFDTRFGVECGRAFREKKELGLIMLDIDNFKDYNDSHGHPQGDLILRMVADKINKTIKRSTDFAARWGGEEFMVILPGTDINGTVNIAEQLRNSIIETNVPNRDGKPTSATVSLGAASIVPGSAKGADDFIAKVDKLLCTAKDRGKNQVCRQED